MIIGGELVIEAQGQRIGGASVSVRLEDVSRADAVSNLLGEQRIELGPTATAAEPIKFAVNLSSELTASCVIRAHVDVDRDGKVSVGDFVSTQSYAVADPSAHYLIKLRKV